MNEVCTELYGKLIHGGVLDSEILEFVFDCIEDQEAETILKACLTEFGLAHAGYSVPQEGGD